MNDYFDGFLELIEVKHGKDTFEYKEKFKFFWNQIANHPHQTKLSAINQ